jgi:hypothetical protein
VPDFKRAVLEKSVDGIPVLYKFLADATVPDKGVAVTRVDV